MFLVLLRALRIESVPPPLPSFGVERRKEQLSCSGASSDCVSLFPAPTARASKEKGFIRKLLEYSKENQNASVFSGGWSSFLGTHPQSLFPQKSKPQNKKKYWALSCPVPYPVPTCFPFSFFLSSEPSENTRRLRLQPFLIGH